MEIYIILLIVLLFVAVLSLFLINHTNKCKHDYKIIKDFKETKTDGWGFKQESYVRMYECQICKKCKTQRL